MRTTVSLDADNDAAVRRLMRERGLTFKQALNQAVRDGLAPRRPRAKFRTSTFAMGQPVIALDKALRLAADLEDDEIIRKLAQRT